MPYSSQDVHKKVLGRNGEKIVESYIKKQGMTVLKRNYKTKLGEADLIAADGDEIAFIEVKTRTSDAYGTPREAVDTRKQERYYRIAKAYWMKTGEEPNARFDVAEVYEDGRIEYYKNAF